MRVLRAFRANRAFLLAGAVAYYTLLSLVPLLILILIVLSGIIDRNALLMTLGRYLAWLIPGQSAVVVAELARFLAHRQVIGWVLLATMVFSSSLAFTVLEHAMAVIFPHRAVARRHFLVSAIIPYCYIMFLGTGLLLMTLASGLIQTIGVESIGFLGVSWSLHGVSGVLLYLLGVFGEMFVLTSIYLVMPAGPLSWRHALIGSVTATVLWEITRHLLVWYLGTLSDVGGDLWVTGDGYRGACQPRFRSDLSVARGRKWSRNTNGSAHRRKIRLRPPCAHDRARGSGIRLDRFDV